MLLAIDTATRILSIAIHDGYNLLAEHTWRTDNNHTAELAPALEMTLARSDLTMADLDALAVSIGPGSYTGLRIGVALAKGLASVRGLPLIGVSSLDTLAAAQPHLQGYGLVTLVEAGRGRIIAATYRWGAGRWTSRGEPQIMTWDSLLASIDGPACIAGDINAESAAAIENARAEGLPVQLISANFRLRRAGFLAEEALLRLAEGGSHDPAHLVPIYVQSKDASD
jgi:tRNA threonylcarbamoyladenosine biosynthesis protein TsaB